MVGELQALRARALLHARKQGTLRVFAPAVEPTARTTSRGGTLGSSSGSRGKVDVFMEEEFREFFPDLTTPD